MFLRYITLGWGGVTKCDTVFYLKGMWSKTKTMNNCVINSCVISMPTIYIKPTTKYRRH